MKKCVTVTIRVRKKPDVFGLGFWVADASDERLSTDDTLSGMLARLSANMSFGWFADMLRYREDDDA